MDLAGRYGQVLEYPLLIDVSPPPLKRFEVITVSVSHDAIQGIKDDRRVDHLEVVELSQVLHFCDPALIVTVIIVFQANGDGLEKVVDDTDHEFLVIPVQGTDEHGQEVDASMLDFAGLREDFGEDVNDLRRQLHLPFHAKWLTSSSSQCNFRICFKILV